MIGQCVRYGAATTALKEMIASGKYGKVIKADFSRLSATPIWSWQNWYLDETQSGGAALDMHIHDGRNGSGWGSSGTCSCMGRF